MAINVPIFGGPQNPTFQGIRPNTTDWGPPDMAQQIQGALASLHKLYQGAEQERTNKTYDRDTRDAMLNSLNNPGRAAAALGQPGGIYGGAGTDTLSGSGGAAAPLRAGGIGASGPQALKPFQTQDPVAGDLAPHQRAFLNGIAGPESGGKYNVRYTPQGGATFELGDRHPGIFEPTTGGKKSSAAGRYQFTKTTWDSLTGGNVPFTPENQDRMAWQLATRDYGARTGRNLDADLQQEGFSPRIQAALKPTWAGLAGGNAGRVGATYQESLDRYASGGPTIPANAPPVPGNFADTGIAPRNTGAGPVPTVVSGQPAFGAGNAAAAAPQAAPGPIEGNFSGVPPQATLRAPGPDQYVPTPEQVRDAQRILSNPNSTAPMKTWAASVLENVQVAQQPQQTPRINQTPLPPARPGLDVEATGSVIPTVQQQQAAQTDPATGRPRVNREPGDTGPPAPGIPGVPGQPGQQPDPTQPTLQNPTPITRSTQPLLPVPGVNQPQAAQPMPTPGQPIAPGQGGPVPSMAVNAQPQIGLPGSEPQPPPPAAVSPTAAQAPPPAAVPPPATAPGGGVPPQGPQTAAVTPPGQTVIPEYQAPQQPQAQPQTTGTVGRGASLPPRVAAAAARIGLAPDVLASADPVMVRALANAIGTGDPQRIAAVTGAMTALQKTGTADWKVISDGAGGFIRYNERTGDVDQSGGATGGQMAAQIIPPTDKATRDRFRIDPNDPRSYQIKYDARGRITSVDPITQERRDPNPIFQQEQQLAKDVESNPEYKVYQAGTQSLSSLKASFNEGNSQGDLASVFQFLKSLDPASTVSAGEQNMAGKTGGVVDNLWALYAKALGEGGMTPETRRNFYNTAVATVQGKAGQARRAVEVARNKAVAYDLKPDRVAIFNEIPEELGRVSKLDKNGKEVFGNKTGGEGDTKNKVGFTKENPHIVKNTDEAAAVQGYYRIIGPNGNTLAEGFNQ